jgi:hypothetical protein
MKFIRINSSHSTLYVGYKEKSIDRQCVQDICLKIDNHINWKKHSDELIPKLSGAFAQ